MNRLAAETSPYLRQHAANPVDWYPWGDEARAQARERDVPILLSVGYSSCHWCHVMAHESFEDPATAAVMNRLFVNVKVDREERPDVDAVYMQAVQAMTGHGGWPMTVWLTPDGRPFFGGTYFPRDERQGHAAFVRVMEAVAEAWEQRRDDLVTQAGTLHEHLARVMALGAPDPGTALDPALPSRAAASMAGQVDARFGGFGRAPKFPAAMTITFLLQRWVRDPQPALLEAATTSLDAMAAGGIYDHVGGGFHRYSVDDSWLVPHFEKMLYDQALLVRAYLHGYLATGEARYERVVTETVEYVLRDLHHPEGGYFSAEDADSEGVEGKFYVWSLDEVERLCGTDAAEVVRHFGVTARGNFVDPHTNYRGSILHVVDRTEGRPEAVERCLVQLRVARASRVRPGLDDKVLLAWNGLFVDALAEAAAALDRPEWMDEARRSARFLLGALRAPDGRLLRSWQDGRGHVGAYAQDYAALAEALITLAEVDDPAWLLPAREVLAALYARFGDDDGGGVFTTAADAEPLVVRPKDVQDNATPSENSLAASAALRLGALGGADAVAEPARRWLRTITPLADRAPSAFAYLLTAYDRAAHAPLEVVVSGEPDDHARAALWREVTGRLLPGAVRLLAGPGTDPALSPLLEGRLGRPDHPSAATAYVCEGSICHRPATTTEQLSAELGAAVAARG